MLLRRTLFALTTTLAALCVLLLLTDPPEAGACISTTPLELPLLLVLGVLGLSLATSWARRLTVTAMVVLGMLPTVSYGLRHWGERPIRSESAVGDLEAGHSGCATLR
jgi:hypothetical protein